MTQSEKAIEKQRLTLFDLGYSSDYNQVWDFQKRLVELRRLEQIHDSIVVVEHNHVLTLGRSGKRENILSNDLPLYAIERGGDVTYHGPGQLVVYPVVSLQERSLGTRKYVELLESIMVETLFRYGIRSEGRLGAETGVWTESGRKIASIGVATSHWITYHGFALNVNTDLSFFSKIKPCGFESTVMTSVANELGAILDLNEVKTSILQTLSAKFGAELFPARYDQNNFNP